MFIRPARKGDVIRDPQTGRRLPDEGAEVADSNFWHRRLRSKDVELCKPAAEPKKPAKGGE